MQKIDLFHFFVKWNGKNNAATKNCFKKSFCNHQSQEQLAEATELGIAQLESGKNFPNLTTISIICKFYNITLDEFFAPLHYPPKEK